MKTRTYFTTAVCLLAAFALWTAAVCRIDTQLVGPQNSSVGFAALNGFIHRATGVHMALYTITDWLGLIPLLIAFGFALMGVIQWSTRKCLTKVDHSLLILGAFYIIVIAAYLFFEKYVVNFRPVLIGGCLEASYPSSTTLLVTCVIPTAILQLNARIKGRALRRIAACSLAAFTVFMVIARLISGVHWFTDIIGGILLSAGLIMLYIAACRKFSK